jgi:hypothetical protein
MGVGLTVLSSGALGGRYDEEERSRWDATLFFFLAVQLIGFSIIGAALLVLGWSIESGHRLGPQDLRAENRFIMALLVLFAITAITRTWIAHVHSRDTSPWERGKLDQASQLIGFAFALLLVALMGAAVDEALIQTVTIKSGRDLFLIGGILVVALGVSWLLLHKLSGGDPSPRAFAQSRRQQQRLLQGLTSGKGTWITVCITAVGAPSPALSMTVAVWVTRLGWYWRSDDAGALARYHKWAASHVRVPTPALHAQVVSVFGGRVLRSRRGMRVTPITRRCWWIDVWRSHRDQSAPDADESSPEYDAGLVCISHNELRAAGLVVRVEGEEG